ncbi:MAG: hypothetical protein CSA62_08840 [Planctomycetota bacterium]|nr:MAG: hypothetical protein CSA62_08840 [Planctomycetota bacterium]
MRFDSIPALLRFAIALIALLTLPSTSFATAQDEGDELPYPELSLAESHSFLDELSTWQQHLVQPEGRPVNKQVRGVFPVGDGQVFGYVGLGRRANTMQGLSGPSYQTAEPWAPKGHWGEMSLDLLDGDAVVPLPIQRIWRTRGVNCVITEDANDKEGTLTLTTLNFAKFGDRSLYRWVEIRNRGKSARKLSLRVDWERGSAQGDQLSSTYKAKGFEALLRCLRPAKAVGHSLLIDLGELAPDAVVIVPLVLHCKKQGEDYVGAKKDEDVKAALSASEKYWRQRLSKTSVLATDRTRLADLVEDWKILMLVQRSAENGAVSPMVSHRGAWVRDNAGPLLAFLRYGLHKEAADLLRYVHDAIIITGQVRSDYPLDLDVSAAEKMRQGFDWSKVQTPDSVLPGWIILQHAWYFRATWDIGLIKRHWPMLEACMKAFRPDAKGTLLPEGDENYLYGGFFSLGPERFAAPCYIPAADLAGRRARSFDSSLIYLMAIDSMSELVEELDKDAQGKVAQDREWTSAKKLPWEKRKIDTLLQIEKNFWLEKEKRFAPFLSPVTGEAHRAPYAAVNLKPQWLGYTYAIGEKNRDNARNSISALWKKGMRVGMTPNVGHFTGDVPGFLLYTLADLDDKRRNEALDELLRLAGPAGEWGQLYNPQGQPISSYSEEWPCRLRPWESGINIDAILFALNGARYASVPGWSKRDQRYKLRMPNKARWVSMTKMQHDGHQYNIYLDEVHEPDKKLDPSGAPVRKLRFRVHYDVVNFSLMQTEFVDVAANVGETLFVRWPKVGSPINETTPWPEDSEEVFLGADGPGTFTPVAPKLAKGAKTLFITAGLSQSQPVDSVAVDIGLPLLPEQLAALIHDGKKRRFDRIVFDVGARDASAATFKTGTFWNHPSLLGAQKRFRADGGEILRPRFLTRFELFGPERAQGLGDLEKAHEVEKLENFRAGNFAWKKQLISKARLDLHSLTEKQKPELSGKSYLWWASSVIVSDRDQELILKVGSDDGIRIWLEGEEILLRKIKRMATFDQDEVLIRLKKGENRLLFKVVNVDGGSALYARLTGTDGLPARGLSYR